MSSHFGSDEKLQTRVSSARQEAESQDDEKSIACDLEK